MHTKEIDNKSRVASPINSAICTFENDVFNLLKIEPKFFNESVKMNISYAVLLRNWIKGCFDQEISAQKVAKTIIKSGVLLYIELSPERKIAA